MTNKNTTAYTEPTNYTHKIRSRYGDPRWITDQGNGWFTIEGPHHYYRAAGSDDPNSDGLHFFDPDGGPFVCVGDVWPEMNGKEIKYIRIDNSGQEGFFKISVEVK
jgi:hypothetical protein